MSDPKEFIWTDELAYEYARIYFAENTTHHLKKDPTSIEEFKKSKEPKERVEVYKIKPLGDSIVSQGYNKPPYQVYEILTTYKISEDKFPAIKQAIEKVLNPASDKVEEMEVLFVTEDGAEMREGDMYWGVNTTDFSYGRCSAIRETKSYQRKNFLLLDNALIYIDINKPKDKPEWEIMSYRWEKRIYTKNFIGEYVNGGISLPVHKLILHPENFKEIHSVKRLSDNEVFSIGDKVIHKDGTYRSKILKLLIPASIKGLMWFEFEEGQDFCKDLANFNKYYPEKEEKKVLFTTEDGVQIKEGDNYWTVSPINLLIAPYKTTPVHFWHHWSDHTFSTKEKAEEYVLLNKPCMSVNDLKLIGKHTDFRIELSISELEHLAKQKING